MMSKVTSKQVIDCIHRLPPFPKVALAILELIENEASIEELVNTIKFDVSITSTCLKLCNNAYYSSGREVTSIENAVQLIGIDDLIKIVMTTTADGLYKRKPRSTESMLWKHSVTCALVSQLIANHCRNSSIISPILIEPSSNSKIFTAALLHDIGKLVIYQFFPEIMRDVNSDIHLTASFEKDLIGINHVEIGTLLAKTWKFPNDLQHVIANHHSIDPESIEYTITDLIFISNLYSKLFYYKDDYIQYSLKSELFELFKLTPGDLNLLRRSLLSELINIKSVFSL